MREGLLEEGKMLKKITFLLFFLLTACTTTKDSVPKRNIDISGIPDAVPRKEPKSRYGNAPVYEVWGRQYYVLPGSRGYSEEGIASWYRDDPEHLVTANRENYDLYKMTAAHKTLPLPTYAKVTNLENGKQIIVRINDRGPFVGDRLIDLSYIAAKKIGILKRGTGRVRVEAIDLQLSEKGSVTVQPVETYLQVGVYASEAYAKSVLKRIGRFGRFPMKIYPREDHYHRMRYHVEVGPVRDAEEMTQLAETLQLMGLPKPIVVTEQG